MRYDVAVVGAGAAGCTAALMYARAGLRVALLEAHADVSTHKRLCTHFVQSSAAPTLARLGLDVAIERAGGLRVESEIHTPFGRMADPAAQPEHGYNLRREVLDPLLRSLAVEAGVDLVLGVRVSSWSGGVLLARTKSGATVEISASLLVGADGRHSRVAAMAGLKSRVRKHERWGFIAHLNGVERVLAPSGLPLCQLWMLDPNVAYCFPTDAGQSVIALVFRDGTRGDPETLLHEVFASLPGAPDLSGATRASDFLPSTGYSSIWRPQSGPRVALVGDAAMSADYVWGVGLGFAFQSAEWLVDATAPALRGRGSLALGLKRYAWQHKLRLWPHQHVLAGFADRRFNRMERLLSHAAARDAYVGRRVFRWGSRTIGPAGLLDPVLIARALGTLSRATGARAAPSPRRGSPSS